MEVNFLYMTVIVFIRNQRQISYTMLKEMQSYEKQQ